MIMGGVTQVYGAEGVSVSPPIPDHLDETMTRIRQTILPLWKQSYTEQVLATFFFMSFPGT